MKDLIPLAIVAVVCLALVFFLGCADDRPDFGSYLLSHGGVSLEKFRADVDSMGYKIENPELHGGGYLWVEIQSGPLTEWSVGFHCDDSVKTMFAYFSSALW